MATQTKAGKRYDAEQALRGLISESGIRYAGTYGHPYPKRPVVRYHVVLKIETQREWSRQQFTVTAADALQHAQLDGHIGKRAERFVETAGSYVTTACGIESLSVGRKGADVVELTDPNGDRATDAPVCKRCERIAQIEA